MGMRRVAVAGGMAILAAAMMAGPAGADTPETYSGQAAGQALGLSVSLNGQGTPVPLTFGMSDASVDSSLNAKADGAAELLTSTSPTSLAKVQGNSTSQQNPQQCGPLTLPNSAPFSSIGLSLATGCSSSVAQVTNNLPSATGSGLVAGLNLDLSQITQTTVPQLGQTLDQVLTPIFNALNTSPASQVTAPITSVLTSLIKTQTLAVTLGPSNSSVTTTSSAVTSTSSAQGAVIKILPNPTAAVGVSTPLSSDPLATITVGQAAATATYTRATGAATDSFDPALVRVHFNQTLLPIPDVSIAPGVDQTILAGTPLESHIIVGSGSETHNGGSATATADGVRLELLRDPGDSTNKTPLITLSLAHATAGVGGAQATSSPQPATIAPPAPVAELPRTGGTPWIPFAGAGALALAFISRKMKWMLSR